MVPRPPRIRIRLQSLTTARLGIASLFAVTLIPGILAGAFLVYEGYGSAKDQSQQSALRTARALTFAVDADLAGIRSRLQILAVFPALQTGDLRTFYRQAHQVLAMEDLAEAIVVIDETGQQVINTLRPLTSDLPMTGHPELLRRTFDSGQPSVSDLYIGGVAKRHFVASEVPIWRDGKVIYGMDMGISAERMGRLLEKVDLPAGWVAALLDAQGTIIARSQNAARTVGQKATPDLLAQMRANAEGVLVSHTLEGRPAFVAFNRSATSGWTVAVAMTHDVLYAHQYRTLSLAGLTMTAFFIGGALLAWFFSRQVSVAVHSLAAASDAATAGNLNVVVPPSGPREIVGLAEKFNRMQRARQDAESRLRLFASVFSGVNQGAIITDRDSRIIDVNQAFTDLTGYMRDEVIGRKPHLLKSGQQSPEFYQAMWQTLEATGRWQGELWDQRKDGTLFASRMMLSTIKDDAGAISHYVSLFSDITDLKRQQENAEHLAYHDPLTQLANRRLLSDRVHHALSVADRQRSLVAICYLDLVRFKRVNDVYGHNAGDQLLREVARRLEHEVRVHDTVARLGGDEFVLLLTDLKSESEVEAILARVVGAMNAPVLVSPEHAVTISASIGVALFPNDGTKADVLFRHADQAMYEAKRAGWNPV